MKKDSSSMISVILPSSQKQQTRRSTKKTTIQVIHNNTKDYERLICIDVFARWISECTHKFTITTQPQLCLTMFFTISFWRSISFDKLSILHSLSPWSLTIINHLCIDIPLWLWSLNSYSCDLNTIWVVWIDAFAIQII